MTVTINDVVDSLVRRGFYNGSISMEDAQTQVDAVIEELGEVARVLRRWRQGVAQIDMPLLQSESVDTVIASICLASFICGDELNSVVLGKMQKDEQRGWRHGG